MRFCVCWGQKSTIFKKYNQILTDYFLISKAISAEVVLISFPFLHSISTGHPSSLAYFQTLGHQTFQTSLKGWLLKNTASVTWFCVMLTSMFIERVFPKRSWDFLPLFFIFEQLSKSFGTGRQLYIWRLKPIICVSSSVIQGQKLISETGKGLNFHLWCHLFSVADK